MVPLMIPAVTQPPAGSANDPVRSALDEAAVRDDLLKHALVILGRHLADRPAADRIDRAREAVQETCVRGLQKRRDYDPSWPARAWLHGILNNVLLEMSRALRRSAAQELADPSVWEQLTDGFTSQAAASVVPDHLDLAVYLARLSAEHREILQLRFYGGLSHEEIAIRQGISPGNARVRLCRAIIAAKRIAGMTPREDQP